MGDSSFKSAPPLSTAPRSEHATTSRLDACERIEWLLRGVRADAARLNVRLGWRQTFSPSSHDRDEDNHFISSVRYRSCLVRVRVSGATIPGVGHAA